MPIELPTDISAGQYLTITCFDCSRLETEPLTLPVSCIAGDPVCLSVFGGVETEAVMST